MHQCRQLHNKTNAGQFGQYKMMQKNPENWRNSLTHRYSSESTQQELSNEYKHDSV